MRMEKPRGEDRGRSYYLGWLTDISCPHGSLGVLVNVSFKLMNGSALHSSRNLRGCEILQLGTEGLVHKLHIDWSDWMATWPSLIAGDWKRPSSAAPAADVDMIQLQLRPWHQILCPQFLWFRGLPSLKLTAGPRKLKVGRWNFILGWPILTGELLVSWRVSESPIEPSGSPDVFVRKNRKNFGADDCFGQQSLYNLTCLQLQKCFNTKSHVWSSTYPDAPCIWLLFLSIYDLAQNGHMHEEI